LNTEAGASGPRHDQQVDAEEAGPGVGDLSGTALRGAGWLAIRQGVTALFTFAGIVVLSALLPPADFALYGYATTVILLAASVGDLGLGAALIRGDSGDRHLKGSFALQLVFWVPVCATIAAVGSIGDGVFGFSLATISALSAALLLLSLQTLPTALLERQLRFSTLVAIETAQRLIFVTVAILLAATSGSQSSIPIAILIAAAAGYPVTLIATGWRWFPQFVRGEPIFRGFSSDWWQARIANQVSYAAYPLLGGLLFAAADVGYMVWAVAITSVPALLAPTVARAVFPAIARASDDEKARIYRQMFRGVLLLGVPLVAIIFTCAEPLVRYVFGERWLSAVPLLRLESVTTLIGLALTTVVPLLFLTLSEKKVKWLMVMAASATWLLVPVLALIMSYRAVSVTTIVVTATVLVVVDLSLRRRLDYSLLSEMVPATIGLLASVLLGFVIVGLADDLATTFLVAGAIGLAQLAVNIVLGGGVNLRSVLRLISEGRRGATVESSPTVPAGS